MRNRRTSPCTTGSTPARPLTLAVVLALPFAGSITAPVLGDVKNWNTDSGAWGTDANWSPTGAPGPGSQVFLGNTLAAVNGTALLNVDATIASLVITDGMSLNTTNFNLLVNGPVTIAGANATRSQLFPSRLWVANGPSLIDVTTGAISLSDGAILQGDGGVLLANGVITVGDTAQVSGTGGLVLNANTSPALIVDGGLSASVGELVIAQNGTGRIDLDGTIAGDHTLLVAVVMTDGSDFSRLRIEGSGLTDAMDDDIQLGPGCELTMHLDEGWTFGAGATLTISSGLPLYPPTQIKGNQATIAGDIRLLQHYASLRFEAPATLLNSSGSQLESGTDMAFIAPAAVDGASFALDSGATLRFDGFTSIDGATFTTSSADPLDGVVEFNGPTTYAGTVNSIGFARQNGSVTVISPTVINADTFDLDGSLEANAWSITGDLAIHADAVEPGDNRVHSAISVSGPLDARLDVELTNPAASWSSNHSLALTGVAGGAISTRLAGSRCDVEGPLAVTNAVQVDAPLHLGAACDVTFATPLSRLRLLQSSTISATATFAGGGRVETAPGSELWLAQGANLGSTDLVNGGLLRLSTWPESAPALAFVDQVIFQPSSTWSIDLGGAAPGFQHDQLMTFGSPSQLAGSLEVHHLDLDGDGKPFAPPIGASFVVLSAPPGSLIGTFANQPVSFVPGAVYHWTVNLVNAPFEQRVTLTVDQITACLGELSGDGVIDAADLAILLGAWGPCGACPADLDQDGVVGGPDLAILLGAWGPCGG